MGLAAAVPDWREEESKGALLEGRQHREGVTVTTFGYHLIIGLRKKGAGEVGSFASLSHLLVPRRGNNHF